MKTTTKARTQDRRHRPKPGPTWRELVRTVFHRSERGELTLAELYAAVAEHPKARANPHWRAKLRQTVQLDPELERSARGVWRIKVLR